MTEPLDLRAVELDIRTSNLKRAEGLALLAHARALRAALQEMLDQNYHWHPDMGPTRAERAAAVLAAAQDGPA